MMKVISFILFALLFFLKNTDAQNCSNLFSNINTTYLTENLKSLSKFVTRNPNTSSGVFASEWITLSLQNLVASNPNFYVKTFSHKNTGNMKSILVEWRGGKTSNTPLVLTSEISTSDIESEYSPGANKGSGAIALMEIVRILATQNTFNPDRTIHFLFSVLPAQSETLATEYEMVQWYKSNYSSVYLVVSLFQILNRNTNITASLAKDVYVSDPIGSYPTTLKSSLVSAASQGSVSNGSFSCVATNPKCRERLFWSSNNLPFIFLTRAGTSDTHLDTNVDTVNDKIASPLTIADSLLPVIKTGVCYVMQNN